MKIKTTIGKDVFFSTPAPTNVHLMESLESEHHVWTFFYDEADSGNAFDFLSPEEKEYSRNLPLPKRRREFIVSRAVLRRLLSLYLGEQPTNLLFGKRDKGKPFLEYPCCALEFNLSHCENTIAVGISRRGAIGIDVESCLNLREDCHSIAERFFTPKEAQWVIDEKTGACSRRFLAVFVQKEAFVKRSGEGMSKAFDSFEVALSLNPFASPSMLFEVVDSARGIFLAACCEQETATWHLFTVSQH